MLYNEQKLNLGQSQLFLVYQILPQSKRLIILAKYSFFQLHFGKILGTPVNPFDLWKGANFKLKIRKVDGFWNYDKSEFDVVAPLHEDESVMETAYNSEHSLKQFHETSNFKTYDELKDKMERVLGAKLPRAIKPKK